MVYQELRNKSMWPSMWLQVRHTTFTSNQEHKQTRTENKSGHSQHEWHFLTSSPWDDKSRQISIETPKLTTISEKYKRKKLHFRTRRPWHDKSSKTSTGTLKKSTNSEKCKRTKPNFRNTRTDISHANKGFLHDMTKKHTQKAHWKQTKKNGHVMETWLKTPKRWRKEAKNLVYKLTCIFAWSQSFDSVFQGKTADKASRQQWLSQ